MKFSIPFFLCSSLKKCFWFLIAKLESELKSIQLQYEEQLEAQSKDLYSAQESIMTAAYDIDAMRRRLEKIATIEK